jgi:hypothetical protein
MATLRIYPSNGLSAHAVRVDSNRTKDIVRGAKQHLPDVHSAAFAPIVGNPATRYFLYNKVGAQIGEAVYLAPMGR